MSTLAATPPRERPTMRTALTVAALISLPAIWATVGVPIVERVSRNSAASVVNNYKLELQRELEALGYADVEASAAASVEAGKPRSLEQTVADLVERIAALERALARLEAGDGER